MSDRVDLFSGLITDGAVEPTVGAGDLTDAERLALLGQLLALSREAFAIADLESGAFLDCSPPAHERLGYTREEYLALGPSGIQADPGHDQRWVTAHLQRIKREPAGCFQTRHRCCDGSTIDVEVHYRVVDHRGRRLVLAVHRDRSEIVATRFQAERLNQLLLEAEQLTRVGSWELNHATGELLWSEGVHRIFETTPETFTPSYEAFLETIHPDDRALVDRTYRQSLEGRHPYQVNHRLCFPDGRQKVVQERGTTTYDAEGRPVRSIGTVQDISQLAEYEQKLERAAFVDALTGLPNRQGAIRHLQDLLTDGCRAEEGVGALNLDLDQFQAFNDTFGPQIGDQLLKEVARVLRHQLPAHAFLARLEGDEFLILVGGRPLDLEEQARQIQQQLQQATAEMRHLPLLPTTSIGIAHWPSHGQEALALLQAANTALSEAKKTSKGGISLYNDIISRRIRQRLALEAELEQALSEHTFQLAFQPQVDHRGTVVGAEVLLRWHDSQGTAVPPSVFIPLAERSGQIHAISAWVMAESCRQLRAWREEGLPLPRLAVNLSAAQLGLGDAALAGTLIDLVQSHGLQPSDFELEVTETALIANPEASRADTLALSQAGFQIAIDDFGTGYASLVSLHTLPVDTIKIDLSFIQRLQSSSTDHAIVKSTILMAHELGLKALAEGVESEQQWNILQRLGCDHFQGFLFGVPMSAEAFAARLRMANSSTPW